MASTGAVDCVVVLAGEGVVVVGVVVEVVVAGTVERGGGGVVFL